ncbi:hypothetical protein ACIOEW_20790 [Streptomyces sp. NPDC087901]|uniref:hypothetical protein n=1 Tax=Streptomyces sp. NPDC087901 TaxID=3365818 RepID=UPI003821A10F
MRVQAQGPSSYALDHPALYVVVAVGHIGSFTALSFVLRAGMALASPTASGALVVPP